MKYTLKEKQKRNSVYSHDIISTVLKSIVQNSLLQKPTKLNSTLKKSTIIRLAIKVRLVNRYILTERRNRFNLLYKFSRLIFLKLARNKDLVGLKSHYR